MAIKGNAHKYGGEVGESEGSSVPRANLNPDLRFA